MDLYEADLSNSDLTGATLIKAELGIASFANTNLSSAEFFGADLGGVDLRGADLSRADLRGAENLTEEQIRSARDIRGAKLPKHLKHMEVPADDWSTEMPGRRPLAPTP